jgi:hypothetical protein
MRRGGGSIHVVDSCWQQQQTTEHVIGGGGQQRRSRAICWFLDGGWVRLVVAGEDWRQSWSSCSDSKRNNTVETSRGWMTQQEGERGQRKAIGAGTFYSHAQATCLHGAFYVGWQQRAQKNRQYIICWHIDRGAQAHRRRRGQRGGGGGFMVAELWMWDGGKEISWHHI